MAHRYRAQMGAQWLRQAPVRRTSAPSPRRWRGATFRVGGRDYLDNVMSGLLYQMVGLSWVDYLLIAAALAAAIYALQLWKNIE